MRIGFTGTQDGMTRAQRAAVFDELPKATEDHEVHHGCCVGADAEFHDLVEQWLPCRIVGHPPLNTSKMAKLGCDDFMEPMEYLARNRQIVEHSQVLIAAPKGAEELRSGTWSTVRYARKRGVPVTIVWPDGAVTRETPYFTLVTQTIP